MWLKQKIRERSIITMMILQFIHSFPDITPLSAPVLYAFSALVSVFLDAHIQIKGTPHAASFFTVVFFLLGSSTFLHAIHLVLVVAVIVSPPELRRLPLRQQRLC